MRRRVFNLVVVASLVSCLVAVALWVRSYVVQDTLHLHRSAATPTRFYKAAHRFYSVRGQLVWKISANEYPPEFARAARPLREKDASRDSGYAASATPGASGWHNGDFNYDGFISGDVYATPPLIASATAVPNAPEGGALPLSRCRRHARLVSRFTGVDEPPRIG